MLQLFCSLTLTNYYGERESIITSNKWSVTEQTLNEKTKKKNRNTPQLLLLLLFALAHTLTLCSVITRDVNFV